MGKYSQGSVNSASFLRQQALTRQRLITESLTPSRTQTNQTTAKVNNFDLQIGGLRDDVAGLESSVSGFDARIVEAESQASNAVTVASEADSRAADAVSTASSAVSTASSAVSTAQSAVSTAEAANSSASSAVSTATSAQSTASTASSTASSARSDAALALSIVSANAVPFVGSGSTASGDVLSTSWADNITVTVPHVQGCDVVTVSVSVFGALIGSGPLDARVLVAGSEVGATQGIPSGTLTTYPGAVSSSQMSVTMQTFIQHTNVTGPIEVALQLKRDSSGSYSLNLDSKIMMQVKAEYGRTT